MRFHYTEKWLLDPTHRVTVSLIGCGGTGTQVLSGLARFNQALLSFGHPGLMVTAYDHDIITDANVGRQLFSPADVGLNKAVVSVTRINRFFGFDWNAVPSIFKNGSADKRHNIVISCIDTAKGRIDISKVLSSKRTGHPNNWQMYWLDFGNLQKTGQVVLGTIGEIKQPQQEDDEVINHADTLPNVVKLFPQMKKIKEKDQGPSCSLAEALNKQDLFINSTLSQLGLNLLWKLFREGKIRHHGLYLNLDNMQVNPININ